VLLSGILDLMMQTTHV